MLRAKLNVAKGAAMGAAAAYLLDPDRGRARRARLRDQLLAAGRRGARSMGQRSRYEAGRVKGRVLRSVGGGRFEPADDRALADHLHGVLSRLAVATNHLTTEVVDGVVRVRGEVANAQDEELVVSALACEPGVTRVENLLHLPGQLPPNKQAGIDASQRARHRRVG